MAGSSAQQAAAAGMIGAVNLGVAIGTAVQRQLGGSVDIGRVAVSGRRMAGGAVTLLAQPRVSQFKQRSGGRTMRGVTKRAVVADRRMLPEEGAAFLGVTGEAGVVDRFLQQQFRAVAAVRIVAVAAKHLALAHRMRRRQMQFGTLRRVASDAGFRLLAARQTRIARRMQRMAARAGDALALVRTAQPVLRGMGNAGLVAGETGFVLRCNRPILADGQIGQRKFLRTFTRRRVRQTVAVAVLTNRRAPVSLDAVPGLIDREDGFAFHFVVTDRAFGVARQRCLGAATGRQCSMKKGGTEQQKEQPAAPKDGADKSLSL